MDAGLLPLLPLVLAGLVVWRANRVYTRYQASVIAERDRLIDTGDIDAEWAIFDRDRQRDVS